jgi:hypothetical protein
MLNDQDKFEIARAVKEAAIKCNAMPGRLKDEFQQAEAEGREPLPITPLTELRADLVIAAIEAIKEVPADIKEIVGVQRKACKDLGDAKVYLLSSQLLAILNAAGFGESNAPIQRQSEQTVAVSP